MTEGPTFPDLVRAAFPVEPLPAQFFRRDAKNALDSDIPSELRNRISGRPWPDVTLIHWRMAGTSPVVSRGYLEPATFLYYVPSLIVGAFQDMGFMDFALEGMIPNNKNHAPRGEWWFAFSGSASAGQRAAVAAFLGDVRLLFWDKIGPANQHLLKQAEKIWLD